MYLLAVYFKNNPVTLKIEREKKIVNFSEDFDDYGNLTLIDITIKIKFIFRNIFQIFLPSHNIQYK